MLSRADIQTQLNQPFAHHHHACCSDCLALSQPPAAGGHEAAASSRHGGIGAENLEGYVGVISADKWSHVSMISNARMERRPVWYDVGAGGEAGLIADRGREEPFKSNKHLVQTKKKKRAGAGCFHSHGSAKTLKSHGDSWLTD